MWYRRITLFITALCIWLLDQGARPGGRARLVTAVSILAILTSTMFYLTVNTLWAMVAPPTVAEATQRKKNIEVARMETRDVLKLIDRVNAEVNAQVQQTQSIAKTNASGVSLLSMDDGKLAATPAGRMDPFEPLVREEPPASSLPTDPLTGAPEPEKPRDILEDLEFVGHIDEKRGSDRVAIFVIHDANGDTTVVKKVGESFTLAGQKVVVKGVANKQASLLVNGAFRTKELSPFEDTLATGQGNGGSSSAKSGGSSSGTGGGTSGGASSTEASGNSASGGGTISRDAELAKTLKGLKE